LKRERKRKRKKKKKKKEGKMKWSSRETKVAPPTSILIPDPMNLVLSKRQG
jgi:hypothetical protein